MYSKEVGRSNFEAELSPPQRCGQGESHRPPENRCPVAEGTPAHAEGPGRDTSRTLGGQGREDAGEGCEEEDAPYQDEILKSPNVSNPQTPR